MKSKIIITLITIVCACINQKELQAQTVALKDLAAVKEIGLPKKSKTENIDKKLIIANPSHGKSVTGKLKISGKANANSSVKIEVTASYYKYVPDYKINKLNRGEGPININVKNIIVKANAAGLWSTTPVNFNNYGYSTTFKIIAKSVEGKNTTYVLVENNKLPNIAWD